MPIPLPLRVRFWTIVALAIACACGSVAEEKKKDAEEKPQPPRVAVVLPLGLIAGATNVVTIRGQSLTNVTAFRFLDPQPQYRTVLKSKEPVALPQGLDKDQAGDTQAEVEIIVPAGVQSATNAFVLVNPQGESPPFRLLTLPPDRVREEEEPNPGFHRPQEISFGQLVRGSVKEAYDVDVFSFDGQADQKIRIEVQAAAWGAATDSVLTLYGAGGHVIAVNDDAATTDSTLRAILPETGRYFVVLQDAHDRGGPLHAYLLTLIRED